MKVGENKVGIGLQKTIICCLEGGLSPRGIASDIAKVC